MAISLASITKTKHASPPRMLIHGPEKVGKSTFFAGGPVNGVNHQGAPAPIFVRTEDGLNGIDTDAFPLAESYQEVLDALIALATDKHDYKTVVIDSADWLERLIHAKVCADDNVKTIELAGGGYGKGYTLALNHLREVLRALDYLNKERGMIVGVICHSIVAPFNDPINEPYDRFEMKLHQPKKSTGARDLLMEWADVIGFAQRRTLISQRQVADGGKVARGVNAPEANRLHLVGSPAFVAGNRYSLPDVIDLNWQAFAEAMSAANQPPKLAAAKTA